MSIYTTQISKLAKSDLDELLIDSAVENLRLEFKSEVPKQDETLKKLSSFANIAGGLLVVGAEAVNGKITRLPGVPLESEYKQRIADWSFIKFSPSVMMECSEPIQAATDRYCLW